MLAVGAPIYCEPIVNPRTHFSSMMSDFGSFMKWCQCKNSRFAGC